MLTKNQQKIIFIFPIIITFLMLLIIAIPFTRSLGFWLLEENKPIEILTFVFFILGGIYGVYCFVCLFKNKTYKMPAYFFLLFSFFLILIGMEEISWGQQFFQFKTPEQWKAINRQGETTLHNVGFMQTHTDTLHLVFGLAGLLGIWLKKFPLFNYIGVPLFLSSWFLIIALQSTADIIVDLISISTNIDYTIERMSEYIEFIIAITSSLYLWVNIKSLIHLKD